MDIVLDSNIFRSDILLKSKEFDILIDYLEKTGSYFIVPQIIYDEIKGLYLRALSERIYEFKKNSNNINLILLNTKDHVTEFTCDLTKELENYESHVKDKLRIQQNAIIPYNNNYLPEIVKRAINRQKPSGDKGQGFRDVLIWLAMKDYAKLCFEKQIIFISSNSDDFASPDKLNLHSSLEEECNIDGVKIHYFKSLKEFIESHPTKIDFITESWLSPLVDYDIVLKLLDKELENRESIAAWFQRKTGDECSGYYNALSINPIENLNFSVYEMIDNSYVANITVRCEVEIEFEFYKDSYPKRIDFDNYDFDRERIPAFIVQYLEIELYFSLTIKNNILHETELNGWSF